MQPIAPEERNPGFVELQLLRHGPSHNQLLSPLTEYLALCGDHSNTTLRIPLEHSALLTRLRALRYLDSEPTRVDQLRETSRIASELLASVPGLIADLSSARAGGRSYVHLSIASHASELALFPFELAIAPDGFPGEGQPLCLQQQLPICLTRRSKNVCNDDFPWDRPVKILFVASDAGGSIPVQQHYALLRKLVEPWVGTGPLDDPKTKARKRRPILRLLTNATISAIEKVICDEVDDTDQPFTHIHVLAHGCKLPESAQRFGVALHHPHQQGRIDAVDGPRLAKALGCLPGFPTTACRFQGPAVVTLATCDSAGQGDVTIPGASLAFELHDSGVPLVVGSQFPLSAEGSIILTVSLYRAFLAGRDPRSAICEARRALQSNLPQLPATGELSDRTAHDWASLTVYAALPDNISDIIPVHRRRRQRSRMDVRLHNMCATPINNWHMENALVADDENLVQKMIVDADKAVHKFEKWVQGYEGDDIAARLTNKGILASAQKQVGLLYLRAADWTPENPTLTSDECTTTGTKWLQTSSRTYRHIFDLSRNCSWGLVQSLVLRFALRGGLTEADNQLWELGTQLALLDEYATDINNRIWALTMLVELQFLRWIEAERKDETLGKPDLVYGYVTRIRDLHGETPKEVFSSMRQFRRYPKYFVGLANQDRKDDADTGEAALSQIQEVIAILSELDFSEFEDTEEQAVR